MANDNNNYPSEVRPNTFLRADEEEQGLITNGGFGAPVRRRGRVNSRGTDKVTAAEMKVQMAAYWKEGDTYTAIAEKVSDSFGLVGEDRIGASGVQYHISSLLKAARKQALLHITERQALILARYDQLEMLLTEAYFASMKSETIHYERMIKQAKTKDRAKQIKDAYEKEKARVEKVNKKRAKAHRKLLPVPKFDPNGDMSDILEQTAENIKEFSRTEDKPAGDPRFLGMLIDITNKKAQLFGLLNRTDNINPDQDLAKLPDEERRSRMSAVIHAALTKKHNDTGTLSDPSPLGGFKESETPAEMVQEDPIEAEVISVTEVEDPENLPDWEWD